MTSKRPRESYPLADVLSEAGMLRADAENAAKRIRAEMEDAMDLDGDGGDDGDELTLPDEMWLIVASGLSIAALARLAVAHPRTLGVIMRDRLLWRALLWRDWRVAGREYDALAAHVRTFPTQYDAETLALRLPKLVYEYIVRTRREMLGDTATTPVSAWIEPSWGGERNASGPVALDETRGIVVSGGTRIPHEQDDDDAMMDPVIAEKIDAFDEAVDMIAWDVRTLGYKKRGGGVPGRFREMTGIVAAGATNHLPGQRPATATDPARSMAVDAATQTAAACYEDGLVCIFSYAPDDVSARRSDVPVPLRTPLRMLKAPVVGLELSGDVLITQCIADSHAREWICVCKNGRVLVWSMDVVAQPTPPPIDTTPTYKAWGGETHLENAQSNVLLSSSPGMGRTLFYADRDELVEVSLGKKAGPQWRKYISDELRFLHIDRIALDARAKILFALVNGARQICLAWRAETPYVKRPAAAMDDGDDGDDGAANAVTGARLVFSLAQPVVRALESLCVDTLRHIVIAATTRSLHFVDYDPETLEARRVPRTVDTAPSTSSQHSNMVFDEIRALLIATDYANGEIYEFGRGFATGKQMLASRDTRSVAPESREARFCPPVGRAGAKPRELRSAQLSRHCGACALRASLVQ